MSDLKGSPNEPLEEEPGGANSALGSILPQVKQAPDPALRQAMDARFEALMEKKRKEEAAGMGEPPPTTNASWWQRYLEMVRRRYALAVARVFGPRRFDSEPMDTFKESMELNLPYVSYTAAGLEGAPPPTGDPWWHKYLRALRPGHALAAVLGALVLVGVASMQVMGPTSDQWRSRDFSARLVLNERTRGPAPETTGSYRRNEGLRVELRSEVSMILYILTYDPDLGLVPVLINAQPAIEIEPHELQLVPPLGSQALRTQRLGEEHLWLLGCDGSLAPSTLKKLRPMASGELGSEDAVDQLKSASGCQVTRLSFTVE